MSPTPRHHAAPLGLAGVLVEFACYKHADATELAASVVAAGTWQPLAVVPALKSIPDRACAGERLIDPYSRPHAQHIQNRQPSPEHSPERSTTPPRFPFPLFTFVLHNTHCSAIASRLSAIGHYPPPHCRFRRSFGPHRLLVPHPILLNLPEGSVTAPLPDSIDYLLILRRIECRPRPRLKSLQDLSYPRQIPSRKLIKQ